MKRSSNIYIPNYIVIRISTWVFQLIKDRTIRHKYRNANIQTDFRGFFLYFVVKTLAR